MSCRLVLAVAVGAGIVTCLGLPACGGGKEPAAPGEVAAAVDERAGVKDDGKSHCEFEGRSDREVVESRGPGAKHPNVRRVYGVVGSGEDRRRILLCREIDTNLDGSKDIVRTYDEKGEALTERADSDYDGKIDTWIQFSSGRIGRVEIDRNRNGQPDERRFYVRGKLSRIQRDTNHDGKPDVWEIYAGKRLERMGVDLDHDGRVDRWDRDEVARRLADEKEREEDEARESPGDGGAASAPDGGPPGGPGQESTASGATKALPPP